MTTIDRRVVEMGFDNKQFETGVQTSVKSLDNLKKGLDLDASAKSLENLGRVGKNFSLDGISEGVKDITSKFSAMGVIGFTVLQNLTNGAIQFAESIAKAVTGINSMRSGFAEYEQGLTTFQTIMANTKSAGTTKEEIDAAMLELSKYANLTIFSYGQMTSAVGQFTSQGVSLKDAVPAIKGIYNAIALTGGDANKAANLVYQLSQALASGTVRLMDWNSITNSGIGNPDFQKQLEQTARKNGVDVDALIKKYGSFRETLTTGWLTAPILLQTLKEYTGDLNAETLKTMGYNDSEIKQIQDLGARANESATKVKSFSQLMETLSSNTVTSWAASIKLVVGDLDKASELWTYVGGKIGDVLQKSADGRNELIEGWARFGGRIVLVDAIKNALEGLPAIIKPITEAFREIFPPVTSQDLKMLTVALRDFTAKLKISGTTADEIKRVFKGVFAIFDIVRLAVVALIDHFGYLTGSIEPLSKRFLDFAAGIGDYFLKVRDGIKANDTFGKGIDNIVAFLEKAVASIKVFIDKAKKVFSDVGDFLKPFTDKIESFGKTVIDSFKKAFDGISKTDTNGLDSFVDKLKVRIEPLTKLGSLLGKVFDFLGSMFGKIKDVVDKLSPVFARLAGIAATGVGKLANGIMDGLANIDYNSLFDKVNAGLLAALLLAIKRFVDKGSNIFGGLSTSLASMGGLKGVFSQISGILDQVKQSLQAWQKDLQSKTLLRLAEAVAILSVSLIALSLVDSSKLTGALAAMTVMFAQLISAMAVFQKIPSSSKSPINDAAISMVAMSVSILLLSVALEKIGKMKATDIAKGLFGIVVLTTTLIIFSKTIDKNSVGLAKSALGLILFSVSLDIIVGVVKKLGSLNWVVLEQGLEGVALILAELGLFMVATNKVSMGIGSGVGLVILATSLLILQVAVEKFGKLDPKVLDQGLKSIGLVLIGLAVFTQATANSKDVIATAVGLTILGASMLIFSISIEKLGKMSWESLIKGLVGIGAALLIVAGSMKLMPKDMILTGAGLVIVSGALIILANALGTMGRMDPAAMAKSLVMLTASLLEIAIAMNAMPEAIPGALALIVVAGSLAILGPVLQVWGSMSWEAVGKAMLMLAGTFVILGVAGIGLVEAVPGLLGLAAAIALIGVAFLAAGAGILMFSAGMAALAVSGTAGAAALVLIASSLIGLLPVMAIKLGQAVVGFIMTIAQSAPAIGAAFTQIMLAIITAVYEVVPPLLVAIGYVLDQFIKLLYEFDPKIVEAALFLLASMLESIASYTPYMLAAGYAILIALLTGLRDNIEDIVILVAEIIAKFLDGISARSKEIIQSGIDLMISFINGMADGIKNNTKPVLEAVENLAGAIVQGLIDGLLKGDVDIAKGMLRLGKSALEALRHAFDSKSPSKKTYAIGQDVGQGLVNGLLSYADNAAKSAKELANSTMSGLGNVVSQISNALSGNMDMSPTITPVIDLSNVLIGGSQIDKILGSKTVNVSGTLSRIAPISAGMQTTKDGGTQINQPSVGASISLVQNNYSPKELSRLELYRQTKNLLSMSKGLAGAE